MRATLVGLIVVATVGFVIGTSIERHNAKHESAAQLKAEAAASATGTEMSAATTTESSGESVATRAAEGGGESGATPTTTATESGGESPATRAAEGGGESGTTPAPTTTTESAGESPAARTAESGAAHTTDRHQELRPFGVNVEAVPFVALAVLASLGLAALGWTRPRWLPGLTVIAVSMVVFGVLDVREAFHQSDENQTGLVILAAGIAVLHFSAGGCAAVMAARRGAEGSAPAASMAA